MNSRPVVFIGSSSEGLLVARALNASMTDFANSTLWIHAFPPMYGYLESLTKTLEAADFAIFILTPDDITESRGAEGSPRETMSCLSSDYSWDT